MKQTTTMRQPHLDALQDRFGARVAAALAARTQQLPHDTAERLRVAREHALARARLVRAAQGASAVLAAGGGTATLGAPPPWWQRLVSVAPLLMLVAGLVLVQHLKQREQTMAAADIDARLLADTLPPAAYADPGFLEFLRQPLP